MSGGTGEEPTTEFVWDATAPPPPPPRPRRWWRTRRLILPVAGLVAVALLTTAAVILVLRGGDGAAVPNARIDTRTARPTPSVSSSRPSPSALPSHSPSPSTSRSISPSAQQQPARDTALLVHWPLAGNAADASGRNHQGTPTGGVRFTAERGGAAAFDGVSGAISTGHLVNTEASFTVSAWVKLTATDRWSTAVSQDARRASGFYLQFSVDDGRWAFSRVATDGTDVTPYRALGPAPRLNGWTHLAGVYDHGSRLMHLYVDRVFTGAITYPTPFAAPGGFVVGRGSADGVQKDWFAGSISDVRVYSRALTASQIAQL